jgi:hypothetical protein
MNFRERARHELSNGAPRLIWYSDGLLGEFVGAEYSR